MARGLPLWVIGGETSALAKTVLAPREVMGRGHRGKKKEACNTFYKPFANSAARKAESRTC